MFRRVGKRRSYTDNLYMAIVLSFVAGIVNICGVLSVNTLTTNVTGHFAFFSDKLVYNQYSQSIVFLLFILSFLLGSFVMGFLFESISRRKPLYSYTAPVVIESMILAFIGVYNYQFEIYEANGIACVLLFSMGMQNALVTHISHAKVRTTHLTGHFTDLGIELAQLYFQNKNKAIRRTLQKNVSLRLLIIAFFFIGCVFGGYSYNNVGLKTLFLASLCLMASTCYSPIRYRFYRLKRSHS